MLSYAMAGTVSIGTASARGNLRVDHYNVQGNATLFNGSVVETGQASADLRLSKGAQITLSANSRGTMYIDHAVLELGTTEIATSGSFQLLANGLRITPNMPNSRATISLKPGNTIEVASLAGGFGVTNDHGLPLANIRPGRVVSFAMQAGASPNEFSGVGLVSFENGTYYLTTDENVKYAITCRDVQKYVGNKVVITGTLQGTAGQASICVKTIDVNGPTPTSKRKKLLIAGFIIGGAVAAGIALSRSSSPPLPASR
jgi:hypothetical protein